MTEQIIDNITNLLAFALIFFVLMNCLIFASIDEYWDWGSIIAVIVIDVFFILLVCIGIWVIVNL